MVSVPITRTILDPRENDNRRHSGLLVLEGQTDTPDHLPAWSFSTRTCPHEGRDVIDLDTGEILRPGTTCNNLRCERCAAYVASQRLGRAASAAREVVEATGAHASLITLTQVPVGFPAVHRKVKSLRQKMTRHGIGSEWLWVVEAGTSTGMCHVHAVAHGDQVPTGDLSRWWGGSRVDVRPLPSGVDVERSVRYLGKGPTGTPAEFVQHMELNAGRLHRTSRNFFTGGIANTTDEEILDALGDML